MDLSDAAWRKSSYSGGNGGQCVEVADGNRPPERTSRGVRGPGLQEPRRPGTGLQPRAMAAVHRRRSRPGGSALA